MGDKEPRCRCGNCGKAYEQDELKPIEDLSFRVEPGQRMPAGECPDEECGALCYLEDGRVAEPRTVDEPLYECEDCGRICRLDDMAEPAAVERDADEEVPAGRCPEDGCGADCFPYEAKEQLHECDNCERLYTADQLHMIDDFSMRVGPDGEVPSGQCAGEDCGALCFPVEREPRRPEPPERRGFTREM
jgi:hypothetical protein